MIKSTLREHQAKGIEMLREALRSGKKRPMLQAPTGSGKTKLAAAIVDMAREKRKRVIFTVPRINLVDQTLAEFEAEGIHDVGVIQAAHERSDFEQPIQIASIQTLQRRTIPKADLVIVDEAHINFAFVEKWMNDPAWARIPFIGLSATPWTKGLGKLYDELIIVATTRELIDRGLLSPFRVFAPSSPNLEGVKTKGGDYVEKELVERMAPLTADVVLTWLDRARDRATILFAVDRAHAKKLQQRFIEAGINAGYYDAYTEHEERVEIAAKFHAREIKIVCSVGCLTTGIDWKVECIVLARPTKSETLFVQMIGRGLRIAEGKDDGCLILDHSNTTIRLGFVTDIHHDALHDGKLAVAAERKAGEEALPKACPKCQFLKPPKVGLCPNCGFKPERQSKIECADGQLVELKPGKRVDTDEKRRFYSELRAIAKERGYSDGWVSNQFRNKHGVWPNHYKGTLPAWRDEIRPETRSWVKSQMIRYAKARGRGTEARP
jgi:DNA repair protein RadD